MIWTQETIDKRNATRRANYGGSWFKPGFTSWNKGKKHSEQTKKKMSLSHKGHVVTSETKRKLSVANAKHLMYMAINRIGSHHSPETKEKISLAHIGMKKPWLIGRKLSIESLKRIGEAHRGEKNWNWNGGTTSKYKKIRNSGEWKQWRDSIFQRDNYTCQNCGIYSGLGKRVELHPHHIISQAENENLRFELDNGQTLCIDCHRKTDNYGSKAFVKRNKALAY